MLCTGYSQIVHDCYVLSSNLPASHCRRTSCRPWTIVHRRPPSESRGKVQCISCAATEQRTGGKGSHTNTDAGGREPHKIFDEVIVTVRSGKGGQGEVVERGAGKYVQNFKYRAGGQQPKQIFLPAAEPGDGWDGGDVLLVADPAVDSLLHLHGRRQYSALDGSNANPVEGSGGPRSRKKVHMRMRALRIPVPLGTVVKRKRGGQLLGELLQPGDVLLVARGGKGGAGVVRPSSSRKDGPPQRRRRHIEGVEELVVEDTNWKADAAGAPGEEATLSLLLRVVADVGIVGLPNAGKSSLLAALTRAKPEVAPYPFTTLMPNLGVMTLGAPGSDTPDLEEWEVDEAVLRDRPPVLADLPGLIEGAHEGKGLGRMFLRHLRRTREMLHVVDASASSPGEDYRVVRMELLMYNPEYCARPHIVALNKVDLANAADRIAEAKAAVLEAARQLQEEVPDHDVAMPYAVVATSAVDGSGLPDLHATLRELLAKQDQLVAQGKSSIWQ